MAIGKSFNLKKHKMTQKLGKTLGLFKEILFIVIILIRGSIIRAERRITLYSQDLYYWMKLLREEIYDAGGSEGIGGKPKHLRQKQTQLYWYCKEGRILYLTTTLRNNLFRWEDLKKAPHLIFFEGEASTCCLVSRHSVSVRQNSSTKHQNPVSTRYSQVWTWEERGMNSECGSDQRTWWLESYVCFRRLWRFVFQRRMPRETEKHKQKIFHPKQRWFQMKRRQWKRTERRSQRRRTKTKGKECPLCCIDGHPPPPKVRVHPGECSREKSQVWKLWKFLNWDNH